MRGTVSLVSAGVFLAQLAFSFLIGYGDGIQPVGGVFEDRLRVYGGVV